MVYNADEQFVMQVPADMKASLGNFAAENNLSMNEVARRAIAQYIGIEYEQAARTRASKYESEEARRAAQYDRAALKRWGHSTGSRLLAKGDMEAAATIARMVQANDYAGLAELKVAMNG